MIAPRFSGRHGLQDTPGDSRAPLISVVVPTYNCASYVSQAVDSILLQADEDAEVIVVDDGSTDGTSIVLSAYHGDPRVRVIRQENAGLGPARNVGLDLCSARYVQFLDADDLLDPSYVRTLRGIVENSASYADPDLICFGAASFFDSDVVPHPTADYSRNLEGRFEGRGAVLRALHDANSLLPNAVLFAARLDLWKRLDVRFRPIYHEDEDILIPLFSEAESAVVADVPLYLRRIRQGSIMTSGFGERSANGYEQIMERYLGLLQSRKPELVRSRDIIRSRLFSLATTYARETVTMPRGPDRKLLLHVLWALKSVEASRRIAESFFSRLLRT